MNMTQDTRDMLVRACDVDDGREETPRRRKGRETKQEREIRLASERQIELDKLSGTWHCRLFELLARCSAVGLTIYARKDGDSKPAEIVVADSTTSKYYYYAFTAEWSELNEDALRDCDHTVSCYEHEQAEAARQQELAKQARSKLTKEELEALKKEISK